MSVRAGDNGGQPGPAVPQNNHTGPEYIRKCPTGADPAGEIALPAVSIIIPLYNKDPYIVRALTSILAQTIQDFEVIVVDDGSTDDGAEVAGQFDDPRIRLIQQENRGVSAARNRGIEASRGELIAFLDADDEWTPRHLEALLRLQEKCPQAGATGRHISCKRVSQRPGYRRTVPAYLRNHGRGCFPTTARNAMRAGEVPLELRESVLEFVASRQIQIACRNLEASRPDLVRNNPRGCRTRDLWRSKWWTLLLAHIPSRVYLALQNRKTWIRSVSPRVVEIEPHDERDLG